MKTFFMFYGAVHIVAAVFGMFGIVDYHLCVADKGKCSVEVKKDE